MQKPMDKMKFPMKTELGVDGDMDEYELIIRLQTKNRNQAIARASALIQLVNGRESEAWVKTISQ